MVFDVTVATTWIMFLAIFPMTFLWLRRAWRIIIRRDYSEVALKGGDAPANPKKYAPMTGLINLSAGAVGISIIIGVGIGYFHYETWTAMAGVTIWSKVFADFIVSRQAHPFVFGRKKREA